MAIRVNIISFSSFSIGMKNQVDTALFLGRDLFSLLPTLRHV